jgi:hypothetical protein
VKAPARRAAAVPQSYLSTFAALTVAPRLAMHKTIVNAT